MDLNEFKTRTEKIDVMLNEQGWKVGDKSKVVEEVDTKQSDFNKKIYKDVNETLKNDLESKFVDYLLLDKNGDPLAIIEAKRTSKDPIVGQKQAEMYAADIKKQTGKDIFIFLSNGYEILFWNTPFENPRQVKGFHSQDALERIRFQNKSKKSFLDVKIRDDIIDRSYQIESVKRVLEGLDKGKRKFLIVQATGTGKTRVSMALTDVLLKSKRAQKILFLTDRKILRDQAYSDGFKKFFPNESKTKVFSGTLDKNSRLYASTIQTFMECYQEFSPGDFDVIISDEAHRSIYNKWKDVFTYFDAIQIGLTATPSDMIERDTFRFFECDESHPTYYYSFEQGVSEGYLADFSAFDTQTKFQRRGIASSDLPDDAKKRLLDEGMEESEMNWEGSDIERKISVKGTNEAIIKEFMDNCLMDKSGTLPAKTIIFAMTKKHAKRLWEAFEKLYPEHKGKLARIIVSEDSRALELKDDFTNKNFPRIAISVDMLDTGVDIPEVCNLVFARPIFSKIKFWQMLGRGTRHNSICEHRDWLPDGIKDNFLIFDFWKNFEFFDMHPEGKITKPSEAITTRLFKIRLQHLEYFTKKKSKENVKLMQDKLRKEIESLPKKSVSIKENIKDLEMALSGNFWANVGLDPIKFLQAKITPLMKHKTNVNLNVASFQIKVERLGLAILEKNQDEIDRLKKDIGNYLNCLPRTLQQVKDKKELLDKVLSPSFWKNISYEDTIMLLDEFSPLMPCKRAEPRPQIVLDIGDIIEQRKLIEFGPELKQMYVKTYQEKVEKKIKALAKSDPTIRKIENDEVITERDLKHLEKTLNTEQLFITEESLQKAFHQHKGTLVQFIKKVLGLYEFPEPEKLVEEEFKTFMVENNHMFNADQINFLRTLQSVFVRKKHIEYKDFFEAPFINIPQAPRPLFSEEILKRFVSICSNIEQEVFV